MISANQDKLNELAVLMELRLAFGPGTRLWANRSREDLCYDWLHFKGRQGAPSLRDFAKGLIARESMCLPDRRTLWDIRRRVAIILKAHHLKSKRRPTTVVPGTPAASQNRAARHGYLAGGEPIGTLDTLGVAYAFPLKQGEMPH